MPPTDDDHDPAEEDCGDNIPESAKLIVEAMPDGYGYDEMGDA